MSDTQRVTEVLGCRLADDGNDVLVGLKRESGEEFTLALSDEHLHEVIASLLAARDLFPEQPEASGQSAEPFAAEAVKIGSVKEAQKIVQTFRIEGGGSMAFIFDRKIGMQILAPLMKLIADGRPPVSSGGVGLT